MLYVAPMVHHLKCNCMHTCADAHMQNMFHTCKGHLTIPKREMLSSDLQAREALETPFALGVVYDHPQSPGLG